jgi:uncharacterized protein (TIGR02001 family)
MRKAGSLAACLMVLGGAADMRAQAQSQDRDRWDAPAGGTWSAKFTVMSEYAYRGVSLTEREPAVQATIGYTLPIVPDRLDLYLEAWGGNVHFSPDASTELTASASLVFYGFDRKLNVWFSAARYNYLESPAELGYNYNEFSLWAAYDFGAFTLDASLSWAPQYYGFSGNGWYKEAEVTVPLKFIRLGDLQVKAFAAIGNQYIERYLNNGLPSDNYWNWEIGLKAQFRSLLLTLSYVDTNLDVTGCGNSRNCEGRVIAKMTKTF